MGHIFNSADLWEDMWAEMSETQKQEICAVNAEELHDKLWQHCTDKHHLCKDCRNNVMWAYDKLTKKCAPPARLPGALGDLYRCAPVDTHLHSRFFSFPRQGGHTGRY